MKYLNYYSVNENVAQAKALLIKNNLTEESKSWKHLRELLKGHEGYMFWFFNQHITNKVPLEELNRIWSVIKNDKGILSFFNVNIIDLKTTEEFWDQYSQAEIKQRVRKLYNEFPAQQKKFFDLKNKEDFEILSTLSLDPAHNSIIKKISYFKTKDSLLTSINRLLNNKTGKEFDKLLKKVKDLCPVAYASKEDEIIICAVNYNTITKLGADTAWCIVRSEHTFNTYQSQDLSIQYIIFLLDMDNNNSKIGLTVNINGYYTAHLKDDSFLNKEKLETILNERGISINALLPKKENVKGHLITKASVMSLLNIGFTKEEIIKQKLIFRSNPGSIYIDRTYKQIPSDLSFFSKKEIEENGLLDKTELSLKDLNKFTKEEIIEKKLIKRVANITLNDMLSLGFNINDINFAVDLERLPGYEKLAKKINSFKSRKEVINFINDTHFDISYGDREQYFNNLIRLCNVGPDDMTYKQIIRRLSNTFKDKNLIQRVEYFNNLGYKIDKNFVSNQFSNYKLVKYSEAISQLSKDVDLVNKYPKLIDICIELINETIDPKAYLIDRYSYQENLRIEIEYLTAISEYLSNYPELYQSIYTCSKQVYLASPYHLRIKNNYRTDLSSTIRNLKFFKFSPSELSFKELHSVFDQIANYNFSEVLKYLQDTGYETSYEDCYDLFKYIGRGNRNTDISNLLIFCIENSIDVDACYDRLVKYVDNHNGPLDDYESKKIKDIIAKSDKYRDQWDSREKIDRINKVLQVTLSTSKYWSGASSRDAVKPEKWYEDYFDEIKNIDYKIKGRDAFKYAIGTIVILASLDKFEDFDSVNYDFLNSKTDSHSWSTGEYITTLVDICKIIAQMKVTNWDWTWRIYLNPEQRKAMYEWINRKVDANPTWVNRSSMQVCYYLYDKPKFDKFLSEIKKVKGNIRIKYYGSEKEKVSTNRILELKPIVGYLAQRAKWDDLKAVLAIIKDMKLFKIEKESVNDLFQISLFYSKSEDDDDKEVTKNGRSREFSEIFKQIGKEFKNSLETIKESFIIKWNDFKNIKI